MLGQIRSYRRQTGHTTSAEITSPRGFMGLARAPAVGQAPKRSTPVARAPRDIDAHKIFERVLARFSPEAI